jgi:hypothetical protein
LVSKNDLKKLEDSINEDFEKAGLPVEIIVQKFTSTPTYALEHSLAYLKTVSKSAHLRIWEIVNEHFRKWLKELGISD